MNKRLFTNVKTKLLICVLTFLVFFSVIQINSYAALEEHISGVYRIDFETNKFGPEIPYIRKENEGYREKTIREMEESLVGSYDASLYSRYDLREDIGSIRGIDIVVDDQGETGRCWIHSINSAIESNLAKVSGITQRFSEEYTDIETMKLYNKTSEDGGNNYISLGFYSSGAGPKNLNNDNIEYEVEDYIMFPTIEKKKVNGVTKYYNESNELTLAEVKDIRNQIKNHIINYGAVTATVYSAGVEYYNNQINPLDSEAYYCDDYNKDIDHQITIIGWDDNYSVTNFNASCRPSTPGAYIVLNSWGTQFSNDGVYYVSYEDVNIEGFVWGIKQANKIDHDTIYQHDELGLNGWLPLNGGIYAANVFTRENLKEEVLTEISIMNMESSNYEIYVNPNNNNLNISNLKKVATVINAEAGRHTIELEEPIVLTGEKFAVIVVYIGGAVGIEMPDTWQWKNANNSDNESFFSEDGQNWIDINKLDLTRDGIPDIVGSNICIKAFTNELEEVIEKELVSISVKEMPQKTSYKVGETLNTTGLKLEAVYSDGTKEEVTSGFTCTPTKLTTEGTQTITVNYEGKTTTFKVTVEKVSEETEEVLTEESSYEIGGAISAWHIENIQPNTSIKTFKTNINQIFDVEIYTEDWNEVTDEKSIVKTGMYLRLKRNGELTHEYMLVIDGDVTKDGKADFSDILSINKHRLNRQTLLYDAKIAADVTDDGKINFNDILKINKFRLGRINEL